MKQNKQNIFYYGIFILLSAASFFFYDYNEIMIKAPQSTHHWRQADCLSFTLNLAQDDCDFFHPQTHSLTSDNYTTGAGVSEAPVLYWFVAQLYKVFGNLNLTYRITNTFIFFLGLLFLFGFLKIIFKNNLYAFIIPFFIFSSPVIAYYASNYLTDTTAFALTLIGWYFFFKYKQSSKNKFLYISFALFTIAGLLKILSLTSLVAIGIIYLIELSTKYTFNADKKLFPQNLKLLPAFIFPVLLIASWYFYAVYYNSLHHTQYFSNRIIPVWNYNFEKISEIYNYSKSIHFPEYYHSTFFIFSLIIFIFNLIFIKKADKFLSSITFLLLLSDIAIVVLWFKAFKDHDYYFINLLMFFVFNIITFLHTLKNVKPDIYHSILSKIILSSFVIFLMLYAQDKLYYRYNGWRNDDFILDKAYTEIKPYLKEKSINRNDTIISIGDITNSYSLYLMNLKGWTQMAGKNKSINEINSCIKNGAKYIFVRDTSLLKEDYLQPFIKIKIGEYKNISIFKVSEKLLKTNETGKN